MSQANHSSKVQLVMIDNSPVSHNSESSNLLLLQSDSSDAAQKIQSARTLGSVSWMMVASGPNQSLFLPTLQQSSLTSISFLYPYDRSQGTINFAVSSNDTVRSFKTPPGTFLLPIMGAVITDSIFNYQVVISNTAVCMEPWGCQLDITLELRRPALVKAVVILTIVINCEYKAEALCYQLLIRTSFRGHHILDMRTHWRSYHSQTNGYSEWFRHAVYLPDLAVCPPVCAEHSTWRATIWLSP